MKPKRRPIVQYALNNLVILVALAAAWMAQIVYVQAVQRPACDALARQQLPEQVEQLAFRNVVIASNQFDGHVCNFVDTMTGFPVVVRAPADGIPYGSDNGQVFVMVGAAGLVVLVGSVLVQPHDSRANQATLRDG